MIFCQEITNIEMSLESKLSKRWSFSRILLAVIVGLTVFSYVAYITYEYSISVMSNYSKSSMVAEMYRGRNFEYAVRTEDKFRTGLSHHAQAVKPCSRHSGPCKDIPDYFKGTIHIYHIYLKL